MHRIKNIVLTFTSELKLLASNAITLLITLGLILMPSIFTFYNELACWDVFKNTGNLKVAIANADEGYTSTYSSIKLNVGDNVISALRTNDQLNWVVTDEEDAIDGAASGEYYAAIVIPKDFSKSLFTFYETGAMSSDIVYYSNQKINAITPQLLNQGASAVSYNINQVFAETVTEVALNLAKSANDEVKEKDATTNKDSITTLSDAMSGVSSRLGQTSDLVNLYGALINSSQSSIAGSQEVVNSTLQNVADLAATTQASTDEVTQALSSLQGGVEDLNYDTSNVKANIEEYRYVNDTIKAAAENAISALDNTENAVNYKMVSSLQQMSSKTQQFSDAMNQASDSINGISNSVGSSSAEATAKLGELSGKLSSVSSKLTDAAANLDNLNKALNDAVNSEDMQLVDSLLSEDLSKLANFLSAPVSVERTAINATDNFGSAMYPLYVALALFIASLLLVVLFKPVASHRIYEVLPEGTKITKREEFFGHFGLLLLINFFQVLILGLGSLFFLGVQAAHPWLFMLCLWVSGITFTTIMYVLVSSFANVGKALGVLLLVIQVTGCGGSYPLQTLPQFAQTVSVYLPAYHIVQAMRAAMFGIFANDFWIELGIVFLFAVPFLLFAFFFRRPLSAFYNWYIKKAERTKLLS